jgi:predicted GH43/DUF377 family glycosyl hydrolase
MKRFQGNPILKPIHKHPWESKLVFNAAAISMDNKVHILYRAMGNDGISRLGYARSSDGFQIDERLPQPVFEPTQEIEKNGCEDPRLTLIDNELFMTYTALAERDHWQLYQISLTSIKANDCLNKNWNWKNRVLPFKGIRNKDAVVFPRKIDNKYVMFHRFDPDICIAYSDELKSWYDIRSVVEPRRNSWDSWKIGAAGTPIELNEGWLCIYHGVNYEKEYSLGVFMLDKNNPEKVLARSEKPILKPTKDYEIYGKVPNVVFSCGNVQVDGKVLIYYGGADSVLCVASYELNELIPKKQSIT